MGMTIDDSIMELEILKKNTFSYMSAHQAFITAIDTMRKYQKIEQIIRNYDTAWEFHTLRGTVDEIREVIENGKD